MRKLFIKTIALLVCLAPLRAQAADWPMFRGNTARTGYAREQAYPPLTQAWVFHGAADSIVSSPAVYKGVVYAGSRDNNLYALDAYTGDELWEYPTGGWVDASPAVSGDAVYCPSADGYLYALDRLTGALLWKSPLGAASVSSPLVQGGRVYVGSSIPAKKLLVFDAATGAALGSVQTNQAVDSAPSSDGKNVYFGSDDGRVYAINKDSFAPAWPSTDQNPGGNYQTTGGNFRMNAVPVSSGTLYALAGHDEKTLQAIEASADAGVLASPEIETNNPLKQWVQFASPVVTEDRIYLAGGATVDSLYALDKATLELGVWPGRIPLGDVSELDVLSSPAMADEIIYAGTAEGHLLAFNSSGVSKDDISFPLDSVYSSPAVANGMVFVGTLDGDVYGFTAYKAAAISSPESYAVVNGTVPVLGYVRNATITAYRLEYGQGEAPASWTLISSAAMVSPAEIDGDTLAYWSTFGLSNGVYSLRLSVDESPVSGSSNTAVLPVIVNFAPSAPSGLTAADVPGDSGNKIRLDWTASSSADVSTYRIYRTTSTVYSLLAAAGAGAVSYIDATAVTGTTFTYVVRAYDGYLESSDSNAASARSVNNDPAADVTPPSAVADLSGTPGTSGGRVVLAWTAPGNDGIVGAAAGYTIRYSTDPAYDWSSFGSASLWKSSRPASGPYGTAETETVTGLYGGTTYYFALKAYDFNNNPSPLSNPATSWAAMGNIIPQAPSGLAVSDTPGDHGGSLTLNWTLSAGDTAGAADFYGYRVYRRTQTTAYSSTAPYASLPAGTAKYADGAAPENLKFYYSVSAFNSSHESPLSAEAWGISADNWRFLDSALGGSVRLPDGTVITVPPGAASQNDSILAGRLDPATNQMLFQSKSLSQANPTGRVYSVQFGNPSTRLLKPAVITIPYLPSEVVGMKEENLRLYAQVSGSWIMVNNSLPDTQARTVTAGVDRFYTFAVMEYVPSGTLFDGNEVYTYPNPARGDTLTFKFLLSDKASVDIDVYDVSGQPVAKLGKPDCPAGETSEIVWKMKHIASGVYEYRLKASGASGSRSIVKRLAIIH